MVAKCHFPSTSLWIFKLLPSALYISFTFPCLLAYLSIQNRKRIGNSLNTIVDLLQITGYFSKKWLYLGTTHIAIQDLQSNGKPVKVQGTKERKIFYRLGRGRWKGRVRRRKLKVQSIVTFRWLRYGSPHWLSCSLAMKSLFFLLLR